MSRSPDAIAPLLEESLDDLFENAPCGYLVLADGTIAKVNRTFLDWTGTRARSSSAPGASRTC